MTMRASLIIEARDRASGAFDRIGRKARDMGRAFQPVTTNANASSRSINKLGEEAKRAEAKMEAMHRAAYSVGFGIGSMAKSVAGWAANIAMSVAQVGAAAAIAGAGAFVAGIISTTSKFEQFQVQLETTTGSAQKAKASLDWITNFAATTPYEIDQVTEAFVALQNYGIDATDGTLRTLGDTAAGMNKPLMDAVEMMADASTMQFERLRSFGITASQEGDRVAFNFQQNGRSMTLTANKNAADIQRVLGAILSDKYGGGMEKMSRTLSGLWANIKDKATIFMLKIGQAGIFDKLKAKTEAVLNQIQKWADDGTLDKWANEISDSLERAVDEAEKFNNGIDWPETGKNIKEIASATWDLVKALQTVFSWGASVKGVLDDINAWVPGEGLKALYNPIGAGIDAINGGARAVTDIRSRFGNGNPVPAPRAGRLPGTANRASGWSLQPAAPAMRPTGQQRGPWRPQAANVGGTVEVRVSAAAGLNVSTRTASANPAVPIRASRGPVMAGG